MNPYKANFGSANPYSNLGVWPLDRMPPVSAGFVGMSLITGVAAGTALHYFLYNANRQGTADFTKLRKALLYGGGTGAVLALLGDGVIFGYQEVVQ